MPTTPESLDGCPSADADPATYAEASAAEPAAADTPEADATTDDPARPTGDLARPTDPTLTATSAPSGVPAPTSPTFAAAVPASATAAADAAAVASPTSVAGAVAEAGRPETDAVADPAAYPHEHTDDLRPPIVTRGLTKRFRSGQVAVAGIDLEVPAGSIFGFLGPNGSGKTTTIRMLLGLIAPTSGSVELLGQEMPKAQLSVLPRVGALVEGPAFYPFWTGQANLLRFDAADRTADPRTRKLRAGEALERVGLSNAAKKKVRAYSLGMRQRLAIAVALMQRRELLVLDEPTNGLDPQGTREVRSLIRELAADGTTIFTSTHLLAEVEQLCTHAAVMSRGRLLRQSTMAELRSELRPRLVVRTPDVDRAEQTLAALGVRDLRRPSGHPADDRDGVPAVEGDPGDLPIDKLAAALVTADVRLHGFGLERPSLEESFVALTGEGFDVAG
ncbi:ABC transporter ATP-binding protein [Kribbella sp. NPDC051770]|uniref:ABC transporter ATP-binding protein n=1 Tax=Kribbella sp. NPDC051770 TaxID=3155413 RepID=UPI00344ADE9D